MLKAEINEYIFIYNYLFAISNERMKKDKEKKGILNYALWEHYGLYVLWKR
jgi:hypothetical protein